MPGCPPFFNIIFRRLSATPTMASITPFPPLRYSSISRLQYGPSSLNVVAIGWAMRLLILRIWRKKKSDGHLPLDVAFR